MAKITYVNKETINPQPSVADKNKVTSNDMNEIKSVVNENDDNIGELSNLKTTDKSNIVNAINEVAQGTSIQVLNQTSSSTTDTYSANFVNGLLEKFGKLLWTGSFTTGDITVPHLTDYTIIVVMLGSIPCIGTANWGIGGIGTYASYGVSYYAYRFNPSGNKLTIDSNNKGGTDGNNNVAVTRIYGLF